MQVLEHHVHADGERTTRLVRDPLHHVFSLNANHLARDGWLVEGKQYIWGWGEPMSASIHVRVFAYCLDLAYRTEDGIVQRECLPIEYSSANFGIRRLLVCVGCDKPFYNLFLRDGRFRCRKCQHLKHANSTQLEGGGRHRPEMTGYPVQALPETMPPDASIWATSAPAYTSPQPCTATARITAKARQVAEAKETGVAPQTLGWRGGRPPRRLADFPCTCGAGDALDGHKCTCPRGRIIYRRRHQNKPLD